MQRPHPNALSVTDLQRDNDVVVTHFDENGNVVDDFIGLQSNSLHVTARLKEGVMGIMYRGGLKTIPYTESGVPRDASGPWNPRVYMLPTEVAKQLAVDQMMRPQADSVGFKPRQLVSASGDSIKPDWEK
ncbi:MAG: hypothetical protein WAV04_03475 [Candidatus Microsaccharimonas sp.]|jgi:hypothetical protein